MKRLGSLMNRLRGITPAKEPAFRVTHKPVAPVFCEDCERPECDDGCVYPRRPAPMSDILNRVPPPKATVYEARSIHEPIEPFVPPLPKATTVSDGFRRAAQDVATAIDGLINTCEDARKEGLRLVDSLHAAGEWHDDFLANYVAVQTQAAAVMRDTWKAQVEELKRKRAALMEGTQPPKETQS